MSRLMLATELVKRPVVTLAGEDVAQVKDLIYEQSGGSIGGFTLNGRGLLAGPLKTALGWERVLSCGLDAVMVYDEGALVDREDVVARADVRERDVLGSRVLTDTGTDLGKVVDVVLEVGEVADVVGYEIASNPAMGKDERKVLIPLPDTLAVSGEALMVPAEAVDFVCDDLAGFGAAVEAFRARLRGEG